MAINKVVVNGKTKIDLTADTVTADKVVKGITFHDASGVLKTGTMEESSNNINGFYIYPYYSYDQWQNPYPNITVYNEKGEGVEDYYMFCVDPNGHVVGNNNFYADPGYTAYIVSTTPNLNVVYNEEFGS